VTYRAGGTGRFILDLMRTAMHRHVGWGGAQYKRVREAYIRTDPPVPVQADGDIIGETPMRFSVAPRALDVILPASSRPPALIEPRRSSTSRTEQSAP
jgi:diacylglycerol kinase (ATP)